MLAILKGELRTSPTVPQQLGTPGGAASAHRQGQRLHRWPVRGLRATNRVSPHGASSVEWYRGWRGHLEFAEIESLQADGTG